MIQSLWIETVVTPPLHWDDRRVIEPCMPIELNTPTAFGPATSDAEIHWPAAHRLVLTPGPGGIFFEDSRDEAAPIKRLLKPGEVWKHAVRVLSSPKDSLGWPASISRPAGPWTDETLCVISDQFLELGRTVGQRFVTRTPSADFTWFPFADAQVTWRRGVIDTLRCTAPAGWEFGRALGLLAVCVPMRALTIRCQEPGSLLKGLIESGGLPCLESLHLAAAQPDQSPIDGFAAAFPLIRSFAVS